MNEKLYNDLNKCINDAMISCCKLACDGVKENIGGPFGACIIQKINEGYKIITTKRNTVISSKDATCHAEINAIRSACKLLDRFDLSDCILVTSSKSCPMCLSAACWAKIPVIYYGTDYTNASLSGFKDDSIAEYIKKEDNGIIKEIMIENDKCLEPFIMWNNKKDKTNY